MKKTLFLGCMICCLLPLAVWGRAHGSAATTGQTQRILVISSLQLNHNGTQKMIEAFRDRWKDGINDPLFDYLELNAERNRKFSYESLFLPYRESVRQHRYDLIVALFEDAVELLARNRDALPEDVPVVFITRQKIRRDFLEQHPNTTGFEGEFSVVKTMRTALPLMPDTAAFAVVTDDLYGAPALHGKLQEFLKTFKQCPVYLLSGTQLSSQEMLKQIALLPPKTVVIFCPWRNYAKDGYASMEAVASAMKKHLDRPYFVFDDALFGCGTIGGYMFDGYQTGGQLADVMEQLLKDKNAARIPVRKLSTKMVADFSVINHYDLNPSNLPAGTTLINRVLPLWETHRGTILFGVIAIALLTASLVWCVTVHIRYWRMTRRTMAIFDALPVRICVVGNDGKILLHQLEADARSRFGTPDTLNEMTWLDNDAVKQAIAQVRATGHEVTLRYDFMGTKRLAVYSALPERLFGQHATMWISQDISELERERNRAEQMQEQNRITLEAIGEGLIATDVAGTVTFFNPVAEELTGVSRANAIGKPLGDVFHKIHSATGEEVASPVEEALRSGSKVISASQGCLRAANGKIYHIADSAFPIFEHDGKPSGAVLVFRDVSFEYEQQTRINNNLQALRYAAKVAHISYFRTSCNEMASFDPLNLNPNWGYENGRAISPERWVLPDDLPAFQAAWNQLLAGECTEIQINYRAKMSGEIRSYKMLAAREGGSDGRETVVFGVVQDITEFSRSERRYDDANVLLQSIIDHIPCAVFAKDIGHEMRYAMVNHFMGELFRRPPAQMIGLTDGEILPERKDRAFLPEAFAGECGAETTDSVCVQTQPDGSMRYFRWIQKIVHLSDGRELLIGVGVDITRSESASEEKNALIRKLHDYVENERIMNSCLTQTVMSTDFEQNMDTILQTIALHLHCDRIFLAQYDGQEHSEAVVTREWLAPDNAPWQGGIPTEVQKILSEWRERLLSDEAAHGSLQSHDAESMLCVPIWGGDSLIGIFGIVFAHSCRIFSDRDEAILRSAAKIVALSKEHGKQQQALDASIREREIIFRNIKVPIMLFDRQGRLVRANPASGVMAGKTPAEILEKPCYCSFCKEPQVPSYCPVRRVLMTQAPARREMLINGREYVMSAEPIFDRNGELINIVESAVDMTEINENRRQLEKAMLDAQAADRAKSIFLATMSHELRTPLNAVIGFSELLQLGGMQEEEQQNYIRSINLAGTALLRLINDVLDLSKIEAEQMKITPEPMNLRLLCMEMEAIFRHSAQEKHLAFHIDCPDDLPVLHLDSLRLRQLLLNLTGNAIKFTHEGSVGIECSFVRDREDRGTVTLRVRDTGIGISEEAKTRIFQPFVQLENMTVRGNRTYEGSGLGLAISQRLVACMGGRLEVTSAPGKGSTFSVILPNVLYGGVLARPDCAAALPANTARAIRVLLVDDVPMNLKVLSSMLKKMDYSSVLAGSGAEALKILEQQRFDVVLTDMWMPGMNGEALAREIRRRQDWSGMRIYAVTADTEADKEFDLSAFSGVLHKPLQMEKIREILSETATQTEA